MKSPKLYLNDPGLLCFLLGIDGQTLRNSPLVGPVWESYIYAEFRKLAAARRSPETLWYYRDDQGRELDFIRMHQGQLDLFEVKWSEAPDQKWFDRLLEVKEILKNSKTQKIGDSFMLCRSPHPYPRSQVSCVHALDFSRFEGLAGSGLHKTFAP